MAHKMLISLCLSFLFFLAFSPSSSLGCNKEDLAALLKIRDAYPRYTFPDSWYPTDPTDDCCFWRGIRCSHRTGRIQRLTFTQNYNLSGPIPTSITGLRYLERLEFFTVPKINGSIPPELARLTRLRQLAIYSIPNLVGPVPPQLAALTKLELFNIYNTSVSGPIPSFLSQLPNLGICFFTNNKFSSIPASLNLGKLTGLGLVNWRANKLSGSIPPFLFGTGTRAPSIFILTGNKLTGDIPASFSNKNFNFVYLDGNKFKGPSAKVFFSKSVSTTQLTLSNNEIAFDFSTVQFPVNLTSLDISHNKIYGSIPESITQLGSLDVSYNDLCGKIPSGGSVQQFNPDSFAHNKCLCGPPLSLACKK